MPMRVFSAIVPVLTVGTRRETEDGPKDAKANLWLAMAMDMDMPMASQLHDPWPIYVIHLLNWSHLTDLITRTAETTEGLNG